MGYEGKKSRLQKLEEAFVTMARRGLIKRNARKGAAFKFSLVWSMGTSIGAYNQSRRTDGSSAFSLRHPCVDTHNGRGVHIGLPKHCSKYTQHELALWELQKPLAKLVVPHFLDYFSEDDYTCQFALLRKGDYCKLHVDKGNIYPQRILGLGEFQGAALRCWHDDQLTSFTDFDIQHRVVEFEARVPHEVVIDPDFSGEMFFVIWYRCYDRHLTQAAPHLAQPRYVVL